MGILSNVVSGSVGTLVEKVADVADKFISTPDEKAQFKLEAQKVLASQLAQVEETARAQVSAAADIIKSEMQQGDNYTKRARPTVIYGGLFFILYNYCIAPTIGHDAFPLPDEFWYCWSGVVGVYTFGRSQEKRAAVIASSVSSSSDKMGL